MENMRERFIFENVILNVGEEKNFSIEGHFEIDDENVEIDFYTREPIIKDFIKLIKEGKRIASIKFIKGDDVKEFTNSKAVSIVSDYFVTLVK